MESKERLIIDVWDWQTRALHWVNALLVLSLMLLMTANSGMKALGVAKALREPVKMLHAYLGHLFALSFLARIIWGFAGNRYARWADIIPLSKEQWRGAGRSIRWFAGGLRGSPGRTVGHDPLASFFYAALFIMLAIQASTGILLSGAEFDTLPGSVLLAGMNGPSFEGFKDGIEEVHAFGMVFMLFFLAAHLIGLVAHELKEKTGLLSSMVHGKKCFPKAEGD